MVLGTSVGGWAGVAARMTGGMRPQEFLQAVRDRVVRRLPERERSFRSRIVYATLQLHYGNPRVHYEVWLVHKTGRIEVGLHFEAEREENARAAATLAPHVHAIRAAVGDDVELEQWTPSWTRLHVTLPLGPLTADLCDTVARRLAGLIAVTHPLLGDLPMAVYPRPAGTGGLLSESQAQPSRPRANTATPSAPARWPSAAGTT